MHQKATHALALLTPVLMQARNPIVLCSFGKDSIVLLHLCLRIRTVPVLFFRFPKFHEKHAHAQQVMRDWDLEVFDMWPEQTTYYQSGRFFEVLHSYPTGSGAHIHLFSGIRERREGESRYLCAVDDLVNRPKALSMYPWDVTVHGHKGTDDPELGAAGAIVNPVSQLGQTQLVVPFVDWTDEDIWAYIRHYHLPYDRARYDQREETTSPDKYPTCYRCLDGAYRGALVPCPKQANALIPNQAVDQATHRATRDRLIHLSRYCEVTGEGRTTPNDAHL
ncbi:MAG: phosphoadenosine phosphosulfate reductase family protein [Alphaproteobacteria bacterium]